MRTKQAKLRLVAWTKGGFLVRIELGWQLAGPGEGAVGVPCVLPRSQATLPELKVKVELMP